MQTTFDKFQYLSNADRKEKMWWGKPGGCAHCREELTQQNTTYCSDKNGYGFQRCNFCLDNCSSFDPCGKWPQPMQEFFLKEGFISFTMFDLNGNKYADKV